MNEILQYIVPYGTIPPWGRSFFYPYIFPMGNLDSHSDYPKLHPNHLIYFGEPSSLMVHPQGVGGVF